MKNSAAISMADVLPIAASLEDRAREINELAYEVRCLGRPRPFTPKLVWSVTEPVTGLTIEGENLKMNLKNTEQVELEVFPKNRKGGPAKVENPVWEAVTETSAFTLEPNTTNPNKALLKGNPNAPGDENDIGLVRFTGDADLGEEVNQITAELAVNITPADATVLDIVAGTPTEQE